MFRLNLKYAMRVLLNHRGFAIVVITIFVFTIGVNATIFSLRRALLERTIPVEDAENLVGIYGTVKGEAANGRFSRNDYLYFKEHLKGVSEVTAHYSFNLMTLTADKKSMDLTGSAVSANFFSMLGLRPVVGRFILPDEDAPGGRNAVAVLSHRLWTREFSADPNIIGKQIKLNKTSFTIIGVAPANFRGIHAAGDANDVWIPSSSPVAYYYCDVLKPDCRFLDFVGRIAEGSSVKQIQAEVDVLTQQLEAQKPVSSRPINSANQRSAIVMLHRGVGALHKTQLTRLLGLLTNAGMVLLVIACVNVSGLFLAQVAARSKEMALRLALGSKQRHLYFQMLTETGLLSLLGGGGGLLIAYWLSDSVSKFQLLEGRTYYSDMRPDTTLIVFTAALVTLCAIIATIIPVIRLSHANLLLWLKSLHSGVSAKSSRIHDALIVAQVALSLALVAIGGLLVMSVRTIQSGPGFNPGHLGIFRMKPEEIGYSREKSYAIQREVFERMATVPGIESVSFGRAQPHWIASTRPVALPGKMPERDEDKFLVEHNLIGPKYLHTLQIPLIAGREFNEGDQRETAKVVIINESLAARLFPNSNAVGSALTIGSSEYTVVGVSKDAQYHSALVTSVPYFYLPFWQVSDRTDSWFCFRTTGDPKAMLPVIRREILKIDADLPLGNGSTMEQALTLEFSPVFLANRVLLAASGIACFLSMLGVYSSIALSVVQRNREIGIRIALGATRRNILKLMIQRGVILAAVGAVLGIGLAIGSARIFLPLLYGVKPTNMAVLTAATIVLISVSLVAGFFPAHRATRVDPIKAIREE